MGTSTFIIGALISFIATTGGIVLQHYLSLGKQKAETRQNASRLLYVKQIEFYDKLLAAIPVINEYITTVNVWLGESGEKAQNNVKVNAAKTDKFWPLQELMDAYYIYLPKSVLESTNELLTKCFLIANKPTIKKTDNATEALHSLINVLRTCVGIDRISSDLFKAFASTQKSANQVQ